MNEKLKTKKLKFCLCLPLRHKQILLGWLRRFSWNGTKVPHWRLYDHIRMMFLHGGYRPWLKSCTHPLLSPKIRSWAGINARHFHAILVLVYTLIKSFNAVIRLLSTCCVCTCIWVYLYSPPTSPPETYFLFIFWRTKLKKIYPIPEVSPGSLTCQVFKHSFTVPGFKISSERLMAGPGIEPPMTRLQVLCTYRLSYVGWSPALALIFHISDCLE
jgi:hypothetical protein